MRKAVWTRRRGLSACALIIGLAAIVGLALVVGRAFADPCKDLEGPFSSVLNTDDCSSPVGICTLGQLSGDIEATYAFTMMTLQNAGDPDDPTKFVYTGKSVITVAGSNAQLFSDDTGVIHIAGPEAPFVTTANLNGGTKEYRDATGQFVATGVLDFSTGEAVGTYTAEICK
ncbi:MAG TPA: hypothetical protein VGY58_00730 [Gemmataceae bacterium]|jgi:hypothetical protein|nr:hypothetical protein [Gemmataceae bacterium]